MSKAAHIGARAASFSLAAALSVATLSAAPPARAQAWLPEPGRGSVYLGYEYARAHWTLFPQDMGFLVLGPYTGGPGNKLFQGEHYGQHVTLDADYGIRRGLAVTAHVAYVGSKFTGTSFHNDLSGNTVEADDGALHGSWQDAELGVRQTVLNTPVVVTPFVAYLLPLQPYATYAHAAVGHHLRELRLGTALARTLRPYLPDAYASLTYAYSAVEREDDHRMHRNSVDMELGYFVTPRLTLKGAVSWVRSSGGIEWLITPPVVLSQEFTTYYFSHDALANERSWRLGGGMGYALTPDDQVYVLGYTTVAGANTHAINKFATGIGWSFTAPWAR